MKIAVYSSLQDEACQQTVRYLLESAHSMGVAVTCHEGDLYMVKKPIAFFIF